MINPTKGLRSMKNMFSLILIASIMLLPSCEIPTDLNDNPVRNLICSQFRLISKGGLNNEKSNERYKINEKHV